jgi:hypothetical protein
MSEPSSDHRSAEMTDLREQVRERYAAAALEAAAGRYADAKAAKAACCSATVATTDAAGRAVFGARERGGRRGHQRRVPRLPGRHPAPRWDGRHRVHTNASAAITRAVKP